MAVSPLIHLGKLDFKARCHDGFALFSSFIGLWFYWVFSHYCRKSVVGILEFLTYSLITAALILTVVDGLIYE